MNPEATTRGTGGPDTGPWVLLAVFQLAHAGNYNAVPVIRPGRPPVMLRRYQSSELAIADAAKHACTRLAGGIAVNLATGETVRFDRSELDIPTV